MKNIQFIFIALCGLIVFGCSPSGSDFQGNEYMPDMGHSVAYEANYYSYYRYNRWGTESEYYEMAKPRKPIQGTIPRGFAGAGSSLSKLAMLRGMNAHNAIAVTPNGAVPYYYEDTEEERTRAMNEIINNPFPITEQGLAQGKNLYDIFCGICHGKKGDGNGYLVADENPNVAYGAQPANLISDEFVSATNGRYYHAIMHGKNVMGGYADKLSYEERWQVIHYIRGLQAKEKKLEYSQVANTLNNSGQPAGANYTRQVAYNAHEGKMNLKAGSQQGGSHGGALNLGGGHGGHGGHGAQMQGTQMMQSSGTPAVQQSQGIQTPGVAVPGAEEAGKKKGKFKKLLEKAGDKIEGGAGKVKDGTKKVGGKLKGGLKKAGNKIKDAVKKDGGN